MKVILLLCFLFISNNALSVDLYDALGMATFINSDSIKAQYFFSPSTNAEDGSYRFISITEIATGKNLLLPPKVAQEIANKIAKNNPDSKWDYSDNQCNAEYFNGNLVFILNDESRITLKESEIELFAENCAKAIWVSSYWPEKAFTNIIKRDPNNSTYDKSTNELRINFKLSDSPSEPFAEH